MKRIWFLIFGGAILLCSRDEAEGALLSWPWGSKAKTGSSNTGKQTSPQSISIPKGDKAYLSDEYPVQIQVPRKNKKPKTLNNLAQACKYIKGEYSGAEDIAGFNLERIKEFIASFYVEGNKPYLTQKSWDDVKALVKRVLLFIKILKSPAARTNLLATGGQPIHSTRCDKLWGNCEKCFFSKKDCQDLDGKLLMETHDYFLTLSTMKTLPEDIPKLIPWIGPYQRHPPSHTTTSYNHDFQPYINEVNRRAAKKI